MREFVSDRSLEVFIGAVAAQDDDPLCPNLGRRQVEGARLFAH